MNPEFLPQKGTEKLTAIEALDELISARTSSGIMAAFAQASRHWINHKEHKNPGADESFEALIRARETSTNRTETLCSLWLKITCLQPGFRAAAPHLFTARNDWVPSGGQKGFFV
ncbi:MAG: hypothetical protein IPN11_14215 [Opitutaceae bacterium]|nr:hypothetical protein [Opitutaceae bacterium]